MKARSIRSTIPALLAAASLAVFPALSLAQGAAGAGSGAGATHGQRGASKEQQDFNRKFAELSQRLKLTEEQSPKVRAIFEAEALKAREIKTKYKGTPDTPENKAEIKKEMELLRTETNTQLQQQLTPAQMAEMQKMHDEQMKKMKDKEAAAKGEKVEDKGEKQEHH